MRHIWKAAIAAGMMVVVGGCAASHGSPHGAAETATPARVVFHVRSHSREAAEADRAFMEAHLWAKRHPDTQIILLVENPETMDDSFGRKRVEELLEQGQGVETMVPGAWGERPKQPLPDGVKIVPDVYLRIIELEKSGWTYIAL